MRITSIIYKKLNDSLSPEEEIRFEEWINESEENLMLFSRLQMMQKSAIQVPDFSLIDSQKAWAQIIETSTKKKKKKIDFYLRNTLKYAAIFVGIMTLCYAAWIFATPENLMENDPNTITLTLPNGDVQELLPGEMQLIKDENGTVLGKKKEGQLDYSDNQVAERLVYNTLSVPNGKRFKVLLSDGSIVHLNSGSSLRYPVKFLKGEMRAVFLIGEAYFDIAKDETHPFVVSSRNIGVHVLGTKFNVTAYPEDAEIKTVLVEGSVSISEENKNNPSMKTSPTLLNPGEKASWNATTGAMTLEEVDTSVYTGWRDGKLVLRKMRFEDIVKRLERHYNVKITNDYKGLDYRIFTATFDVEDIDEVLSTFTEETYFEYTINANTVHIYEPGITHQNTSL